MLSLGIALPTNPPRDGFFLVRSRLFDIARVLVRLKHVARVIMNLNHSAM